MKHLKRFDESYRSLYHPISFSEYTDLASNMVEWSDRDINRIKSHPKLKGFEFGQYPPIGKGPVFFHGQTRGLATHIDIYKIDDYWYVCQVNSDGFEAPKFYKCDEIDGLMEMIDTIPDKVFLTEELTSKYKEETDIIYKDRNLVCMVPKSQMTSHIYGKKTSWCQVTKSGFGMWTKPRKDILGLLVRFLFKSGRKIRFSYFTDGTFHWANEQGWHVLMGKEGDDVFNPKCPKKNIRDLEKDILEHIKLIPEECKEKVREFLERNRKEYQYIYREEGYMSPNLKRASEVYNRLMKEYRSDMEEIRFYYRASYEDLGNELIIEPTGYHEATDDDGNLIYKTGDEVMRSNIAEISASKYVGGAVLGLWSMLHQYGKQKKIAYIYTISDTPYKDLSNNRSLDFEYLKEVRFNKPVYTKKVGIYKYTEEFNNGADLLYTYLSSEPWDELSEFQMEKLKEFIDNLNNVNYEPTGTNI